MFYLNKSVKNLAFIFGVISLSLGLGYLVIAWTGPAQNPPSCVSGAIGCDAPINVGSAPQIKSGNLQVNALGIQGAGNVLLVPNGNVGIGTATPAVRLDVNGAIKFNDTSLACDATVRGSMKFVAGGAGVADSAFQCIKGADDVYVWKGFGVATVIAAPSVVAGLSAVTTDINKVTLSWIKPSENGSAITKYKIYRGTVSEGETLLATTLDDSLTYTDLSAVNGSTTYYYKVSAVNGIGEGNKSVETSIDMRWIYSANYASCPSYIYYIDTGVMNYNSTITYCTAIGGRLPSLDPSGNSSELSCIFTNKSSLGSFSTSIHRSSYYTGDTTSGSSYGVRFDSGEIVNYPIGNNFDARCVK